MPSTREFRANKKAWAFFQSQPPSYRKPATWWVVSAKKDETKARRLATLIDDSEHGLRIKHLRRPLTPRVDRGSQDASSSGPGCSATRSNVVVERELPGVRAQPERVDLVDPLVLHPRLDHVGREHAAREQELVVGLERVEHFG